MGRKKELARKPVSAHKRPTSKKSQYRYYVKVWDENLGTYSHTRSICSIATELNLDEQKFPTTSRTGAFLIGQELLKRSGSNIKNCKVLLADYCATFWDWNKFWLGGYSS
jgi:hypothetical protein